MVRLPSFRHRAPPSTLPEKMDGEPDLEVYRACLKHLAGVNVASFGYRPTVRFVEKVAAGHGSTAPLNVLDVGSGYGDALRVIMKRLTKRGMRAALTGADLNPHAALIAQEAGKGEALDENAPVSVRYVTADARALATGADRPDLIISSLFTHHLEDDEVEAFVRWMDQTTRIGWFINDLYRSRFAATGFYALTVLTQRHPYVRHDGPVSFARAFRRADWQARLAAAGVDGARIFMGAPFRLCVEKVHEPG
ncbi:MAG: methyltransferase domain-containing protein [Pseudomonadota bacterium]